MTEVKTYLIANNIPFEEDAELKKCTTFKVGGKVSLLVTPESKQAIIDLVLYLYHNNIPFKVLGHGSNILPSDKFYEGVIIKTNKALDYLDIKDTIVTVGSGYSLIKLAYRMLNYELSGLEFLGGIPGSIGGAVFMNAGAYKREISDSLLSATIIDRTGRIKRLEKKDLQFGYRSSILQKEVPLLIIEAELGLEKSNKEEIKRLLLQRKERRLETQPLNYPSAGSTFRNPVDNKAYLLIDEANLRGFSIGGAKVSEKHCNFIINYNNATASDIKNLIEYIISLVYKKTGVTLIPEIELFNW